MQEAGWERSLHLKSNYLIDQYRLIVQEFFPGCNSLEQFVELFSTTFHDYQNTNPRKMDPDSIREGKISCSSAAALLGVWWMQQFPQLSPVFLIENTQRTGNSRASAHVNVALPMSQRISAQEALSAFANPNQNHQGVHLIDWTTYSKMKPSNPNKSYDVYPVPGVDGYVRDRLRTFGLPKKYSTQGGMLAVKNEQ